MGVKGGAGRQRDRERGAEGKGERYCECSLLEKRRFSIHVEELTLSRRKTTYLLLGRRLGNKRKGVNVQRF